MKIIRTFAALLVFLAAISDLSLASADAPIAAIPATDTTAMHKGTVISSFDEDGYTYVKYQDGKAVSWVAVLQVAVKERDIIEFPDSQALLNYQSRTLKEPFEKIIFATDIKISEPEKSTPTPSEEVKPDKVVSAAQGEVAADKPVLAVAEEIKTEKEPVPKTDVKKSDIHRGIVISSMKTVGYSYIEYEEDGVVSWVAVTEMPIKAGDIFEFPDSQMMSNFGSKSLKKTFERLYFVSELRIVPKERDGQKEAP